MIWISSHFGIHNWWLRDEGSIIIGYDSSVRVIHVLAVHFHLKVIFIEFLFYRYALQFRSYVWSNDNESITFIPSFFMCLRREARTSRIALINFSIIIIWENIRVLSLCLFLHWVERLITRISNVRRDESSSIIHSHHLHLHNWPSKC